MQYLRYIFFAVFGVLASLIPLGFFVSWFFSVSPPVGSVSNPDMTATQIEDAIAYHDRILTAAMLAFPSAGAIAGYMYARSKKSKTRNAEKPKAHALD